MKKHWWRFRFQNRNFINLPTTLSFCMPQKKFTSQILHLELRTARFMQCFPSFPTSITWRLKMHLRRSLQARLISVIAETLSLILLPRWANSSFSLIEVDLWMDKRLKKQRKHSYYFWNHSLLDHSLTLYLLAVTSILCIRNL